MSKFSRFLKENKAVRENVKYVPTKSFTDENGNPIEWTIKPLTTKEAEAMRDKYTKDVPILGKPNQFKQQLDVAKYNASLIAKSVVENGSCESCGRFPSVTEMVATAFSVPPCW